MIIFAVAGMGGIGKTALALEAAHGAGEEGCRSLEVRSEFEDWYGTAQTLDNLALAHMDIDHSAEARACYLQAADDYTQANAPTEAADAQSAAESLT
ncbi:hypothetical protein [Streptomyces sp. NPDC001536]|uniref:hypothetical protein n=1 Tax=Streptomyces sp. NPDC001536 TaxID=3364583 RepID=UPI0036ACD79B